MSINRTVSKLRIIVLHAAAVLGLAGSALSQDLSVIAITQPVSGCALTSTENVTIRIFNYGLTLPAGTTFNVSYTVNAGAPVTELVTLGSTLLTNSTLNYTFTTQANLSAPGTYTFTATSNIAGDINPSNNTYSGYVGSNAAPSVGGTVYGGTNVCISGNSGLLTLAGHTGSVLRWDYTTDGGGTWNPLSNTTTSQSYSNLVLPTGYRAVVQNSSCAPATSSTASITIDPATVGGILSPASTSACSGANSGALTLTGRTGNVVRWERSTDSGLTWTNIANTTASLSYLNLTLTTLYRVLVQSGACASAYSAPATVTVAPSSVGGSVLPATQSVCAGANGGSVTLSGQTGSVVRWESSTDAGATWNQIVNVTASQSFSNLATTTLYRAVVQSGTCSRATSSSATVAVDPAPAAPPITAATTFLAGVSGYHASVPDAPGSTWTWAASNGAVTGGQGSREITFTAGVPGVLTLTVVETSGGGCSGPVGSLAVPVEPAANLGLTIGDAPDPIAAGESVTYTLTVSNQGPSSASGVTLLQSLPTGAAFVSVASSQGVCGGGSAVVCLLGSIQAGGSSVVTVVARPGATGNAITEASVTSAVGDPDEADNVAQATTTVTAVADLAIAVTAAPDPVVAGQSLVYTLTVSNLGPSAATNITVVHTLPSEVSFVSATGTGWSCGNAAGVVTCTLPSLAVGLAAPVTVAVTAAPAPTTLASSAAVSAATPDPRLANNSAMTSTVMAFLQPVSIGVGTSVFDTGSIFYPGLVYVVVPYWRNPGTTTLEVTGVASSFTGPGDSEYRLWDAAAAYPPIVPGSSADCGNNCYQVEVGIPSVRPVTHWDTTLTETLSTGDVKTWVLHVGDSFSDTHGGSWYHYEIETLLHRGVTLGCSATEYCPASFVTRAQMAMFIARAIAGSDAAVPASGSVPGRGAYDCQLGGSSVFQDVTPEAQYCRHVHLIAAQGITLGCDAVNYCPAGRISRAQMAMLTARRMTGSDAAVPMAYADQQHGLFYDCNPSSPMLFFGDVTTAMSSCRHIHYVWATGVIGACAVGYSNYCPTSPVTRDEMARFLVKGFGLKLYGP